MFKNKRFLSNILLIFFILSIVLTNAFVFCSVDHDCIGEGCAVCCEMNLMRDNFSNLLILAMLFVFSRIIISSISYLRNRFFFYYSLTPIELKVKISE